MGARTSEPSATSFEVAGRRTSTHLFKVRIYVTNVSIEGALYMVKKRHLAMLSLLSEVGVAEIDEVRRMMNMPVSTLFYDVRLLERLGLIRRRGGLLMLTSEGRRLVELFGSHRLKYRTHNILFDLLVMKPLIIYLLLLPGRAMALIGAALLSMWMYLTHVNGLYMLYLVYFGPPFENPLREVEYLGPIITPVSLAVAALVLAKVTGNTRDFRGPTVGFLPILVYPSLMVLLKPVATALVLDMLRFLAMLASSVTSAIVVSFNRGSKLETAFVSTASLFFILPTFLYLALR